MKKLIIILISLILFLSGCTNEEGPETTNTATTTTNYRSRTTTQTPSITTYTVTTTTITYTTWTTTVTGNTTTTVSIPTTTIYDPYNCTYRNSSCFECLEGGWGNEPSCGWCRFTNKCKIGNRYRSLDGDCSDNYNNWIWDDINRCPDEIYTTIIPSITTTTMSSTTTTRDITTTPAGSTTTTNPTATTTTSNDSTTTTPTTTKSTSTTTTNPTATTTKDTTSTTTASTTTTSTTTTSTTTTTTTTSTTSTTTTTTSTTTTTQGPTIGCCTYHARIKGCIGIFCGTKKPKKQELKEESQCDSKDSIESWLRPEVEEGAAEHGATIKEFEILSFDFDESRNNEQTCPDKCLNDDCEPPQNSLSLIIDTFLKLFK